MTWLELGAKSARLGHEGILRCLLELICVVVPDRKLAIKVDCFDLLGYHFNLLIVATFTADRKELVQI